MSNRVRLTFRTLVRRGSRLVRQRRNQSLAIPAAIGTDAQPYVQTAKASPKRPSRATAFRTRFRPACGIECGTKRQNGRSRENFCLC